MTNFKRNILLFLILNLVIGCSNKKIISYKELSKDDPHHINYTGSAKIGSKYRIKNKIYTPKAVSNYNAVGMASWYGGSFHNKKTANGERFNKHCLTAAHPTLPLPSLIEVQNLNNKKSIILLVNDRGPFSKNRLIDVSEKAASILGFKTQGVAKVKVKYLPEETEKFLKKISIKHSKKIKLAQKKASKRCSINCHVKLINMKYGFPFEL